MKTNNLKAAAAMGLTALLLGSAAAQESMSKPVGYETISIESGFNYIGLRLHEAPVASGTLETINADSVVDDQADFTTLAAGTYVLEVNDGKGIVQEVTSFTNGTTIPTDDLSAGVDPVDPGAEYTIRPVASLASVFGAANESGISAGAGSSAGADQVWVPDGSGGFNKYYYDTEFDFGDATWADITTDANGVAVAAPSSISLFYTDGLIVVGDGPVNDLVITGSVKLSETSLMLAPGFNYLSSVSPAGANLATMFGAANERMLGTGVGSSAGADQVWIPAAGGFNKYYYDLEFDFGDPTWADITTDANGVAVADASTISLEDSSGFIIVNDGAAQSTTMGVPSFYTDGTL